MAGCWDLLCDHDSFQRVSWAEALPVVKGWVLDRLHWDRRVSVTTLVLTRDSQWGAPSIRWRARWSTINTELSKHILTTCLLAADGILQSTWLLCCLQCWLFKLGVIIFISLPVFPHSIENRWIRLQIPLIEHTVFHTLKLLESQDYSLLLTRIDLLWPSLDPL